MYIQQTFIQIKVSDSVVFPAPNKTDESTEETKTVV